MLKHSRKVDLRGVLRVSEDIGQEGWAALREALSWGLHDVPHLDTCLKTNLASARKEDLRAIWECLSLSWKSYEDNLVFEKQRGEKGLIALERFLDLTSEEWEARKRARMMIKPIDLPLKNQVVLHLGCRQVEVEMEQPGGLIEAIQQAVLFHPAFGQAADQVEQVQGEVGQDGQVDQVEDQDEVGQAADQLEQVQVEVRQEAGQVDDVQDEAGQAGQVDQVEDQDEVGQAQSINQYISRVSPYILGLVQDEVGAGCW